MADLHLDATGLLCPLPVLKTRKRMQPLEPGQTIEVLTDDPAAVIDMPHFCQEAGHEIVTAEVDQTPARWVILKGA